ncbi:MAG: serine hydrolase domain-containing protein [Chitinophagaceae bacterium]
MKKIIIVILLLALNFFSFSQTQQQKIDSVCVLVKKYFNEKNVQQLYNMAGAAFRKELSLETFEKVCDNNLFPLGEIKETVFEKNNEGVSKYKAVFNSVNLSLLLSLDSTNKIETFLFQPYANDTAKKNYKVATSNALTTPLDKEVDAAVQPYMMKLNTTGLSLGILKDGKIYFYSYGETAKDNHQLPDKNTIFEIGSISKTFTATLLADAVNKGKVKLNDPVSKYLPDSISFLQFNGELITLKTLSNHSSGIPRMPDNFMDDNPDSMNPYKDYDEKKLFAFYKNFKPVRKPGEKYEYSNLAQGTLGVILEKVNHKSYEELFVKTICDPLGMNDTREFIRRTDSARFAKGYDENGQYNSQWDFKALEAAGSIRSTASDLIKYIKGNLGEAPPQLYKDFQLTHVITFSDGSNKVGLAWHYIKPGNDEVIFHNGGTGGFRSYLAINLQKKFAVVVLSNTSIGTEEVGNALMKWLEIN